MSSLISLIPFRVPFVRKGIYFIHLTALKLQLLTSTTAQTLINGWSFFRVPILHNVVVVTEYVLGCLECCYNDHQMQKRFLLQMV